MGTKELKVQAPEGYEIDKENSTFEYIKFKPIKKDITYKDVCNAILKNKTNYYIDTSGRIEDSILDTNAYDKNNTTNKKQLERLLALNQLLNIAEYYNKQHGIGIITTIMYDNVNQVYSVTNTSTMYIYGIKVVFNRKEDAQAVIDNPNFREILDTIYKD